MVLEEIFPGKHVHYISHDGATPINGVVKRRSSFADKVFVVFNCNNDWDNYIDYTAQLTPIDKLYPGFWE